MTSVEVHMTAEVRTTIVVEGAFPAVTDDPIDGLGDVEWFHTACFDLLNGFTDGEDVEYGPVDVEVTVTRPNPLYAGPDVLFGDPPSETVTETGRVTL